MRELRAIGAIRLTTALRPAVAAAAVSIGLLALPAISNAAQPARRLTGETLTSALGGPSYFVPGACYSGGPASSNFSFAGTAAGPYPGAYRETGTISYQLRPVSSDDLIAVGPVTSISATFTITSAAGTVTGTEHLDRALAADQDVDCYESAGGTSFQTSALIPAYTATIKTSHGTFRDRGTSSATLASFVALGGSVAGSSATEALTSTAPACHRERSRPGSRGSRWNHRPRGRRHERRGRHRRAAGPVVRASGYWCSASNSA